MPHYAFRVAFLIVPLIFALPSRASAEFTIKEIATGIESQHFRVLHIPNGLAISYRLHVEQMKGKELFAFEDGAKGRLALKWPALYGSLEGRRPTNGLPVKREGEYNFASQLSAGRDGLFAQITPYRHQWSSNTLLPLAYMYYDEADQKFAPDKPHRSSYWLPSCLNTHPYKILRHEIVDSSNCVVVTSLDGNDLIWIAADLGFAVTKREIFDRKTALIKERTINGNFLQITDGVWFPRKQSTEVFNYSFQHTKKTGHFTFRVSLTNEISLGLAIMPRVSLPEQTQVDDQTRGIIYVKAKGLDRTFNPSLKQARLDIGLAAKPPDGRSAWPIAVSFAFSATLVSSILTWILRSNDRGEVA